MTDIDLDELEAKARAATTGPWHWAGNTDTGEPYLATWIKGAGRCQVLSIGGEDRSLESREAREMRDDLIDCGYDDAETEAIVEDWATDMHGQPRRDPRLEFMTDLMLVKARDRVVYEVAPDATSRDDPRVYRADVVGIRHPDAEFMAAAHPAVVLALVEEVRAARNDLAQVRAETLRGAADVVRAEARWQQENIMRGAVQKSGAQTAVERLLVVEELLRQQAAHFESADRIEREGS